MILKTWMIPGEKTHYALKTFGGIAAIVLFAIFAIWGIVFLIIHTPNSQKFLSLLPCLILTAILVFLAVRLGSHLRKEAIIFCKDEEEHLYVIDIRQIIPYERGISGFFRRTLQTQSRLKSVKKQLIANDIVPDYATEIQKVEQIKENPTCYTLICQVRYPNKHTGRCTCFLPKGYFQENDLLYTLNRKRTWKNTIEPQEKHHFIHGLISLSVLISCSILCFLSHPSIEQLSSDLYFPCLGIAFIALYFVIYFFVKHRRGE